MALSNLSRYVCGSCGQPAYYDGRCGDGPILMCGHGYPIEPVLREVYENRYGK